MAECIWGQNDFFMNSSLQLQMQVDTDLIDSPVKDLGAFYLGAATYCYYHDSTRY